MNALATAARISRDIWRENQGLDRFTYQVSALVWQVKKRFGGPFTMRLHNGARVHVEPASPFSGLFYFRWPDRAEVLFIRANAHLARVMVDVGANVGLFSTMFVDCFERFYLFEPGVSAFSALERTTRLNPSRDWRLFSAAVSDQATTLRFRDEGGFSSTSAVVAEGTEGPGVREVACMRLEDALAGETDNLLLKVDVEGHELAVFRGARRLFETKQVRLVMFERLGRTGLAEVREFFAGVGYAIFRVTPDGRITQDDAAVAAPLINLFACPTEIFTRLRTA